MSFMDNSSRGKVFQIRVRDYFEKKYGTGFEMEKKIPIGDPPKLHRFDIVNLEKKIGIECKRYTWTEAGNVPSGKIGTVNEAAFYLSFLPDDYEKYIVMSYSFNLKRNESLAQYYYRNNRHLLGKTKVAEFDLQTGQFRIIG